MTDKERLERIIQMQYDGYTIWDMSEDDLVWLIEQAEKAERYEKALREIANEQEVGEGDFNADDIANNLIATAKEALEGDDD